MSKRAEIKAEMNFVPFIDVMLVLLIIFMVTSQTIKSESSIDVNLPKASGESSEYSEVKSDNVVITMGNNELFLSATYFSILDKKYSSSGDLALAVKALLADRPMSKVFLRADKSIPYGEVTTLIDYLSTYGVEGVSLVLGEG